MINQILYEFALWLDRHPWSTAIHESLYLYSWIESTHVLALMLFLGLLLIVDLRLLGVAFNQVKIAPLANAVDKPMMIGFFIMLTTGILLFYAIPVRTTQSIWFRIKIALMIIAAINAFFVRRRVRQIENVEPARQQQWQRQLKWGAGLSLALWFGVITTGRMIAYDWWDCHKPMADWLFNLAGCLNEPAT